MYEFGGVYADLDVSALKRWDEKLTRSHSLLIPEDNEAHTVLAHGLQTIPLSAIIMSTPGHRFFAHIIRNLEAAHKRTKANDLLGKAGPIMVARALEEYKSSNNDSAVSICDSVYVPYHNNFNPDISVDAADFLRQKCSAVNVDANSSPRKKKICAWLKAQNFQNKPPPKSAYTNHAFTHTYSGFGDKTRRDIKTVIGSDMFVDVKGRYMVLKGANPGDI
ncbi:uncharacterized protein LOC141915282 [Tubulanus polymorphus]|uniref:uncharacterized protein LOC141915282 n=1 Tax=Tubulanus polymorphus TaxID=672921 RepID=UPI003DA57FBA